MPLTRNPPCGAVKLSADLASLINSSYASDVRFLVGPDAVPMYGHSLILRCRSTYFAALFDDENEWKEKSKGIVQKPNISPITFHALLSYIYTGSVVTIEKACLLDLLTVAEEMELEELSRECQIKVMTALNQAIDVDSNARDDRENAADGDEQSENLPITLAIRMFLLPAFILAYNRNLSDFLQELLGFTFSKIETILNCKEILGDFLRMIPSQILRLILNSDLLPLAEYRVWDLALEWACRQTGVLKPAVELQLKSNAADKNDDDGGDTEMEAGSTSQDGSSLEQQPGETTQTLVSDKQLVALKTQLNLLIPAIRFTLMSPEEYARTAYMFAFFLPARRLAELQRYLCQPDKGLRPDAPRVQRDALKVQRDDQGLFDSNIANAESQKSLRQWIIEANGITNCNSPADLKFSLLYRASIHGFAASVFHQQCDDKGPTLMLVKSSDGHLFGGVSFISWLSSKPGYNSADNNFLFALRDEQHRRESVLFTIKNADHAISYARSNGPIFGGGYDLCIADQAQTNRSSYSNLGHTYTGANASDTTLAGARNFTVMDYEVFAISQ